MQFLSLQSLRRHALTLACLAALALLMSLWQQNQALRNYAAPQGMQSLSESGSAQSAQRIGAAWRGAKEDQGLSERERACCDSLARARRHTRIDDVFVLFYTLALAGLCWRLAGRLGDALAREDDLRVRRGIVQLDATIGARVQRAWLWLKRLLWRLLVPVGYLLALAMPFVGWLDLRENALLRQAIAHFSHTSAPAPDWATLAHTKAWLLSALGVVALYLLLGAASFFPWRMWLQNTWHAGKRCAYIIAFLLAAIVLFVLLDQGQDYLRIVTQDDTGWWKQLWFCVGALAWAVASFYYARLAVQQRTPHVTHEPIHDKVREWLPRVLGAAPLAVLALGFVKLGKVYWAVAFALASAVMWFGLINRRRWFLRGDARDAARVSDESIFVPLMLVLALALSAVALICMAPVTLPRAIGTAGLVFWSAVVWIVVGTTVFILLPLRNQKPTLASLPLALFVLFSPFNDNHEIAHARVTPPPLAGHGDLPCQATQTRDGRCEQSLRAYFDDWLDVNHGQAQAPVPVYVVIAEGGGVRAAYWTASVLAQMQDRDPAFRKHLFAISGISGGSLGAAVFDTLLKHDAAAPREPGKAFDCPARPAQRAASAGRFERCAQAVLRADFLAPALAGVLVTDAAQRFIPRPFAALDRARNLESAWEEGWSEAMGGPRGGAGLQASFTDLWRKDCPGGWCYDMPLLFLNGAVVQTGQRIVTAPLQAEESSPAHSASHDAGLHDAVDTFARSVEPISLKLSTAAHMSARFPIISPAGWFKVGPERQTGAPVAASPRYLHVVDGGAFEPLGSSTAFDLIDAIKRSDRFGRISLRVLVVTNSAPAERDGSRSLRRVLGEVFDQPLALWNSRQGHADYFTAKMQHDTDLVFGRIGMYPDHPSELSALCTPCPPPLGWSLSACTADEMDRALHGARVQKRVSAALARGTTQAVRAGIVKVE